MATNKSENLTLGFSRTKLKNIKGKRLFNTTSLFKKEALPGMVMYTTSPCHHRTPTNALFPTQ